MNTATQFNWTTALPLLAFMALGASSADAAQVRATLSSREAYIGVPVTLHVEIDNARSHEPPAVPDTAGADVTSAGAPRRSSQTTIINGKVDERSSLTYVWQITPRHEGTFTIPPLQVKVDGRSETTLPQPFVATKSETGDLLFVEVSGQHDKVYVGQPLELKLKIWIKPYHDSEFDLTLSEGNMWQMIAEQTNWGSFTERMKQLAEENKRPGGEEVLRADDSGQERSYYLYEIDATIYPKRPGQIDAGDVQIVVNYPTRLGKSRDPFASFFDDSDFPFGAGSLFSGRDFSPFNRNTLTIADSRPLAAGATVDATDVSPIPTAGRPADYRGAVGNYQIITQAVPTTVKAGDPITLHIGVTGTGPMELVQAPPLASLPELTTDFKVPDEPLAGVVQDNAKLFTVSIRPRREGITEIPAIPLSFFDPAKEEFVTVHSDPIAIQVDKADTLALASIVGSANSSSAGQAEGSGQPNAASTLRLDNFADSDLIRSTQPFTIWGLAFPLLVPPLVFLGVAVGRNWRTIGSGFAKFRFAAASSACRALDAARSPSDISRTVLGYVARRVHSNPNTITRDEAVSRLREHGVAEAGDRVDQLLTQCERSAYAGVGETAAGSLITQAKDCIQWLSQQRLSHTG
jgi:hypothetical protein